MFSWVWSFPLAIHWSPWDAEGMSGNFTTKLTICYLFACVIHIWFTWDITMPLWSTAVMEKKTHSMSTWTFPLQPPFWQWALTLLSSEFTLLQTAMFLPSFGHFSWAIWASITWSFSNKNGSNFSSCGTLLSVKKLLTAHRISVIVGIFSRPLIYVDPSVLACQNPYLHICPTVVLYIAESPL